MKRIIDGKRYDTDTAKEVANWSNGLGYSDFSHCIEELYRTKNGNYFLHGEGGPKSSYAKSCGNNSWGGSCNIIAMTPAAALNWLENSELDVPEDCPELSELVTDA